MSIPFSTLFSQALKGKTLARTLFNDAVERNCKDLHGRVLDLAGGEQPAYLKTLPKDIDLTLSNRAAAEGIHAIDFNQPLPFADSSFDSVLLFNALYIAERPQEVASEIRRVLKDGGVWYLSSPFIANEMPEPHDYVRYSYEGIERLCREAGFQDISIERLGNRVSAAVHLLHPLFYFKFVRALIWPFALWLDRHLPQKLRYEHPAPLFYFVECKK